MMPDPLSNIAGYAYPWILGNFVVFLAAFVTALVINYNFNSIMVGLIYMIPLVPLGFADETAGRFLIVSVQNTVFGLIELAIFAVTVRGGDAAFDKKHIQQLLGHTLPIAAALIGLSLVSRSTAVPVGVLELALIALVFAVGAAFRVLAVVQLGREAFKFDIVFREEQKIKKDQLYSLCRHPSYAAMMVVVLAYAMTTHSWLAGALGMLSAWFGFQYRIHHEEIALQERFGEDYKRYRQRTAMWLPLKLFPRSGSGSQVSRDGK